MHKAADDEPCKQAEAWGRQSRQRGQAPVGNSAHDLRGKKMVQMCRVLYSQTTSQPVTLCAGYQHWADSIS